MMPRTAKAGACPGRRRRGGAQDGEGGGGEGRDQHHAEDVVGDAAEVRPLMLPHHPARAPMALVDALLDGWRVERGVGGANDGFVYGGRGIPADDEEEDLVDGWGLYAQALADEHEDVDHSEYGEENLNLKRDTKICILGWQETACCKSRDLLME